MLANKKDIASQVKTMLGGHITALIINLLFYPVISRFFDDDAFAEYSIFLSLNVLLTIAGSFRMELAIPMVNTEKEVSRLVSSTLYNWVISISLYTIGVSLLINRITETFEIRPIVLYLVIPASLLGILFQTFSYIANRGGQFKLMARSKVIFRITQITLIIVLYYLQFMVDFALFLGIIISTCCAIIFLFLKLTFRFKIYSIQEHLKTLRSFSSYWSKVLPTDLINIVVQYIPVWLITYWFSNDMAGQYAFGITILLVPVQVISNSISPVFYKTFMDFPTRKQLRFFWLRLFYIGIIPCLIGMTVSRPLFLLVFGSDWELAAHFFQILCFLFFLTTISNSTSMAFLVLKLEHFNLIFSAITLISIVGSLWIGNYFDNIFYAVYLIGGIQSLLILAFNFLLYSRAFTSDEFETKPE